MKIEVECSLFISILSHIIGLEKKTQFFLLFNILISVFLLCLQCAVNSLPLSISQPQSSLSLTGKLYQHRYRVKWIWGLWNARPHIRKKKSHRPGEISYRTMDLVPFRSSHYPVSEHSDSDGWELSSCVWGGFGCVGAITADIPLSSAAVGKDWRRVVCSEVPGKKTKLSIKHKTNKYRKFIFYPTCVELFCQMSSWRIKGENICRFFYLDMQL